MTYDELLVRCRKTLDLYPEGQEGLRDFQKVIARTCIHQGTALALYSCLFSNLVEYIEASRNSGAEKTRKPTNTPCTKFVAKIRTWPDGDWVCDTCGAFSGSPQCRYVPVMEKSWQNWGLS